MKFLGTGSPKVDGKASTTKNAEGYGSHSPQVSTFFWKICAKLVFSSAREAETSKAVRFIY